MRVVFAVTEVGTTASAGDYFTAQELGSALAARWGWEVGYLGRKDGYKLDGVDLLCVMVDDYDLGAIDHAKPTLITTAWARNHFEEWCRKPWINHYTTVLASSIIACRQMGQQLRRLVPLLRIATNPQRFNGDDRPPQPTIDLLFTCSYWQAERDIVAALSSLPDAYRVALCACALASQVDIFTSTDDLLLKKCHKVVGQLNAQRPAEALAILEEWYED